MNARTYRTNTAHLLARTYRRIRIAATELFAGGGPLLENLAVVIWRVGAVLGNVEFLWKTALKFGRLMTDPTMLLLTSAGLLCLALVLYARERRVHSTPNDGGTPTHDGE